MADYSKDVKRILQRNGWKFERNGKGDHQIWIMPSSGKTVSVDGKIKSRHSANEVLKQAGLDKMF